MKAHFVVALTALLTTPPAALLAVEFDEQALLALLEQETRLATGSQLNADFIPGMATILRGEELRARGLTQLAEALALVPGISIGRESTGERLLLSRGVGHGYSSGNIRLLLNGVAINSSLSAQNNPLLNMPLEQIERIEVIRGPGSSIHGEYAYAGVVDVITRNQGQELYLHGGSHQRRGSHALFQWQEPASGLQLSANLAHFHSNGADSWVERDGLYQLGDQAYSHAPGKASQAEAYNALLLGLEWQQWSAAFTFLEDSYGDHFGINNYLPPHSHRRVTRNDTTLLALERNLHFTPTLEGRVSGELLRQRRQRDRLYVIPGGLYSDGDDIRMDLDYREQRSQAGIELYWQPLEAHQLLFAVEGSRSDIQQGTWRWYNWPGEMPRHWIDESVRREIRSLVLQDQYLLSEPLTLTATLRYDHYSDLGEVLSPRLAAVWRVDPQQILKLQYAHAFRPATFYERNYPVEGESLGFSEIKTLEGGYIHKLSGGNGSLRLTLFHSELIAPIVFDSPTALGYVHADDLQLHGAELEWEQRLAAQWRLHANLSYVRASDRSGHSLPGETRWLANLGLLWKPDNAWTLALQGQQIGERIRHPDDPRPPLGGYATFDFAFTRQVTGSGAYLRGGISNLTNRDARYPDQIITDTDSQYYLGYPNDYPIAGRQWWLGVGYHF